MKALVARCLDQSFDLELDGSQSVTVQGIEHRIEFTSLRDGLLQLQMSGKTYVMLCKAISESAYEVWVGNHIIHVELEDERSRILSRLRKSSVAGIGALVIRAPMPGLITALEVQQGETVQVGNGLLVLEAMKMENEIRSTIKGKVRRIDVSARQAVEKDQQLMIIDPLDE